MQRYDSRWCNILGIVQTFKGGITPFPIKIRNVRFGLINNSKNVEKSTNIISYSKKPVQKCCLIRYCNFNENILHMKGVPAMTATL